MFLLLAQVVICLTQYTGDSMSKKITSAQINDATQTRFVPGPEKKPDMLTRQEASKELKKRGYKEDDEPGVWLSPEGSRLAWFIAVQRENIKFDSKTWGAEITRIKYEWKEKKRLAKLKVKNGRTSK